MTTRFAFAVAAAAPAAADARVSNNWWRWPSTESLWRAS